MKNLLTKKQSRWYHRNDGIKLNTLKPETHATVAIIWLVTLILVAVTWHVEQVDKRELVKTAYATEEVASPSAKPTPTETRAQKLQSFLEGKGSPLAPHAEYIVKLSDENDIPWTLSVSISGKESSFGKAIRPGSNNAWGFMSWDSKGVRSIKMFPSWEAGIKAHIELLGKNYKRDMNAGIQRRYCPSFECSETWVSDVTRFAEEINK